MEQGKHVFISYSRVDAEFALRLANELRAAGVDIWLDQLDIQPGARWDREVEQALATCERLLLVVSPDSVKSENVMDEIGFAMREKRPIIPVMHRACKMPLRLHRLQYLDFTKSHEAGLEILLRVLREQWDPDKYLAHESTTATKTGSSVRRSVLIAGAVAVLGLVGYWLVGRNAETTNSNTQKIAANPNRRANPTLRSAAPAEQLEAGYFVIGLSSHDKSEAEQASQRRNQEGFNTFVVHSSEWQEFKPDWYFVVFSIHKDEASAKAQEAALAKRGLQARVQYSGEKRK